MRCLKLLFVLLILTVATPVLSQQFDATGVWRSTTGYVFRIPESSRPFELIITSPGGQRTLGQARWVREGYSFTYTVSGMPGNASASYNAQYDALEVRGPGGTSWWRRTNERR
jgi:hypothetical protein